MVKNEHSRLLSQEAVPICLELRHDGSHCLAQALHGYGPRQVMTMASAGSTLSEVDCLDWFFQRFFNKPNKTFRNICLGELSMVGVSHSVRVKPPFSTSHPSRFGLCSASNQQSNSVSTVVCRKMVSSLQDTRLKDSSYF